MTTDLEDQAGMILAAEDCDPERFDELHRFSPHDERLIRKLMAHGPLLLRGGRGSGKSALMIAASRRLMPTNLEGAAIGVYLSLRHLPLLRSTGAEYEGYFCRLLIDAVRTAAEQLGMTFDAEPAISSLQPALNDLAHRAQSRVVLFFDDAAHIGREASLAEFFDIFRTISSSAVSCKAAIYPGVTRFGTRFDVYNDATTADVARSEDLPGFADLFGDVFTARYPQTTDTLVFTSGLDAQKMAGFLGRAVLGNMRAFVFACERIVERAEGANIGLGAVSETLIELASNYYWPLLEELRPKLGIYEPIMEPAHQTAEALFEKCGQEGKRSALVHRDTVARLSKPLEMLEYAGFISRREASRAMKSGGRGSRYSLSLPYLFEKTPGARLTGELFELWQMRSSDWVEFHRGSALATIDVPAPLTTAELAILDQPVERLAKSDAYPYGLTDQKIEILQRAGIETVGDLARATDDALLALWSIGPAMLNRMRNVVGQAVWM